MKRYISKISTKDIPLEWDADGNAILGNIWGVYDKVKHEFVVDDCLSRNEAVSRANEINKEMTR